MTSHTISNAYTKFGMSVNAMQKNDSPMHMLRYLTVIFFKLRFSLHVLNKHNSKAVSQFSNILMYRNYTAN